MDCPVCGREVLPGRRGQRRTYCSTVCRKRAELHTRALRKMERFVGELGPIANRDDVLALLSAAARTGSVAAAQTLLRELRSEVSPEDAFIDELASRTHVPR